MCRVIGFLSSCGGVGKTEIVFNVSKEISKNGQSVCVIDSYFNINSLSLKFEKSDSVDLCGYLTGRYSISAVLNKYSRNLYFVKTNILNFDYYSALKLISHFINEIKEKFDYILIDLNNFDRGIYEELITVISEAYIISDDDEVSIKNLYKIINGLKSIKSVLSVNVILNKLRVIKSLKGKCFKEKEIEEILKCDIFFSIPKVYKNKSKIFLKNENVLYRYYRLLSYNIITNKNIKFDIYKNYKGLFGYFKKLRYFKYE